MVQSAPPNQGQPQTTEQLLTENLRLLTQILQAGSTRKPNPPASPQSEARKSNSIHDLHYAFIRICIAAGIIAGTELFMWAKDSAIPALRSTANTVESELLTGAGSGAIYSEPIREGDEIEGYPVTSGFGNRDAPTAGASTFHKGIDLATPTGTNLYMIGTGMGTVECEEQPDGYGTYAIIRPEGIPFEFMAGHLSRCTPGEIKTGQAFAQTGNSGISTGPHLDWRQSQDGEFINPTKGYLIWVLRGTPPNDYGGTFGWFGPLEPGDYGGHTLDEEQVANAAAIAQHARALGATETQVQAALMAALQESSLRNVPDGDADSVGLFQQRPSQGWGTNTDAASATEAFLMGAGTNQGLMDVAIAPGSIGSAIQEVQRSAYPDEYDKWEPVAVALMERMSSER